MIKNADLDKINMAIQRFHDETDKLSTGQSADQLHATFMAAIDIANGVDPSFGALVAVWADGYLDFARVRAQTLSGRKNGNA